MSWASLILIGLKLVLAVMEQVKKDQWVQEGTDAEIARVTQAILAKTNAGKQIMDRINALTDTQVDAELRGLEPTK